MLGRELALGQLQGLERELQGLEREQQGREPELPEPEQGLVRAQDLGLEQATGLERLQGQAPGQRRVKEQWLVLEQGVWKDLSCSLYIVQMSQSKSKGK